MQRDRLAELIERNRTLLARAAGARATAWEIVTEAKHVVRIHGERAAEQERDRAEQRVTRQKVRLARLVSEGRIRNICEAATVLDTLEHSLRLAEQRLQLERDHYRNPWREA